MKNFICLLSLTCLALFNSAVCNAQINQPKEIQTSQKFGEYTVHYNVFNSKTLTGEIASAYKLTRGRDIAIINISLTKTDNGQTSLGIPATISGKAINLMQQTKNIEFTEIKEPGAEGGNATYYLAQFRHTNEEDFRFEIKVLTEGANKPLVVTFTRRLFTE